MAFKRSLWLVLPLAGGLLMGAGHDSYEACPDEPDLTLHVDGDNGIIFSPPGGAVTDGDSWQNAYRLLQDALDHARDHVGNNPTDTVLIKVASTSELNPYRPDQRWNHPATCPEIDVVTCLNLKDFTNSCAPEGECPCCPPFGDCDTDVAFELHNRVVIFGGFPPGGGTCEQRNPGAYPTVLSGDIGMHLRITWADGCDSDFYCRDCVTIDGEGDSFTGITFDQIKRGDNSRTIVRAMNVNDTAVLDGFVIRGANGFQDDDHAGIAVLSAGPIIRHCIVEQSLYVFTTNKPETGAVLVKGTSNAPSEPRFIFCTIRHNDLSNTAAVNVGAHAHPVFIGCELTENAAPAFRSEGPLHNNLPSSGGTIVNSSIRHTIGNTAPAVEIKGGSALRLWNTLIVGNKTDLAATIWVSAQSDLTNLDFINCTIADNQYDQSFSPAMRFFGSALTVNLHNVIVWHNSGDDIVNPNDSATLDVSHSNIAQKVDDDPWPGDSNISEDPLFEGNGSYRLTFDSPSIDTGDNCLLPENEYPQWLGTGGWTPEPEECDDEEERIPVDRAWLDRIAGPNVDQGAFEYQPAPCPADFNDDGEVDVLDLLVLLDAWGPNPGHPADLNGDGTVDVLDLLILLDAWGPCPSTDHPGGGGTVPVQFQDCWDDYQVHGDPDRFLGCMDWVENMDFYLAP